MKLLAKKEITVLKAKETRMAQDEGLKLAKRVDSLREIQAEEEKSLKQFREKTISVINAEIVEQTTIRDLLKGEVAKLQDEKQEALKPLDEEWERVKSFKSELDSKELSLQKQGAELDAVSMQLHNETTEIRDEKQRIEHEKERTNQLLREADNQLTQNQQMVSETQKVRTEAETLKNILYNEIAQKELSFSSRDERQKIRDNEQDLREQELNQRETRLMDRENRLLKK